MNKVFGVASLDVTVLSKLKRSALLFDGIYLTERFEMIEERASYPVPPGTFPEEAVLAFQQGFADFQYLQINKVVLSPPPVSTHKSLEMKKLYLDYALVTRSSSQGIDGNLALFDDFVTRATALSIAEAFKIDAVPILFDAPPPYLSPTNPANKQKALQDVLSIGLDYFPTPDEMCDWERIIDVKNDLKDKRWGLHRFLRELATKQKTITEITDEIEWNLNTYRKAMEIHKITKRDGFLEVCVIPAVETLEDVVKLNWSKIAKGLLGAKKRKIELMEAELNAPGRECAYIFDMRKEFKEK